MHGVFAAFRPEEAASRVWKCGGANSVHANVQHRASFDVDEYRLVGSGMVNVWYGGHVSKEVVSIRT
jgi:hypothetical protein